MNEELVVLKAIQAELKQFDPQAVGEVRVDEQAGCLTLLDGNLTVRASVLHDEEMHSSLAHVHVRSDIESFPDGPLDACVVGVGEDREEGLAHAGSTWVSMVGGPTLSLCRGEEVGDAAHFSGEESWGVQGCHGFVGPVIARCGAEDLDPEVISKLAMFDNAAELTPGGIIHIAKAMLSQNGKGGWTRQIEIDGHGTVYADENWDPGVPLPSSGNMMMSRFAIYHLADRPEAAAERQALDDAITAYVKALQESSALDPALVVDALVEEGHRAEHAYWIEHFVPLAFGRVLLENIGVSFSDTYFVVQRGGRISEPRELMRNPVFARAQALGWNFRESADYRDGFKRAAVFGSEFNALNNALNAGSDPENITALPPIIPDLGVDQEDMTKATETYLAQCQKEQGTPAPAKAKKTSWWQFWK